MAWISGPKLSFKMLKGGIYRVSVNYMAKFTDYEVQSGFTFRDGFVVWEWDPVTDDQLTNVVGIEVFKPTTNAAVRVLKSDISADTLDTEENLEELYAVVRLRNVSLNILWTKATPIVEMNP